MARGDVEPLSNLTRQSFTGSTLFEKTFDEGMALVEETARYLDGSGREESRGLPRKSDVNQEVGASRTSRKARLKRWLKMRSRSSALVIMMLCRLLSR